METEIPDYEKVERIVRNLPMTWYPALLLVMVKAAYEKRVFRPGKAGRFIDDNCDVREVLKPEPLPPSAGR